MPTPPLQPKKKLQRNVGNTFNHVCVLKVQAFLTVCFEDKRVNLGIVVDWLIVLIHDVTQHVYGNVISNTSLKAHVTCCQ